MWMHRSSLRLFLPGTVWHGLSKGARHLRPFARAVQAYGDPRFEPDIYTCVRLLCIQQNQPEMAEPLLVRLEHEGIF
jgi:hypothetical protein